MAFAVVRFKVKTWLKYKMESFITHTEKYKIKKTLIFTSDPLNVIKLYKKVMFSENGDILHLKLNKKIVL